VNLVRKVKIAPKDEADTEVAAVEDVTRRLILLKKSTLLMLLKKHRTLLQMILNSEGISDAAAVDDAGT